MTKKKPKPKRKHAHLHSWARIDRAGAMFNARVHLGAAYDLLEVDADFGLVVLQQAYALRAESRPSLTSFAALLAFHRATELLDGVSILIKAGSVVPAIPLQRSLLESVMYSRYLMTVNDERVAGCYIVSQQFHGIANFEARAREHASGSAPTIVARQARQAFEDMLAEDRIFREARTELTKLNQTSSSPVPWYEAFDGPRTLGGLSGRINDEYLEKIFELNYDSWSAAVHVSDTLHALGPEVDDVDDTEHLLVPLRSPRQKDLVLVVRICHEMFLVMLQHHLEYFRAIPAGMDEFRLLEERLRSCLVL